MRASVLFSLLVLVTTGCTATKASYHLVSAELTVNRARAYGADVHAIYEYTMALRYLDKAREENGYAEYRMATELALTASEWADQAVISMDERGLKIGDSPALLPGQTAPAAGPAPVTTHSKPAPAGYAVPSPGKVNQ